MEFQHILQTRFSVKFPWGLEDFPLSWLEQRIELLDAYCLPSIRLQSCQDFTWLVYCDESTDQGVLSELESRTREVPQMQIMMTKAGHGFFEATREVIDRSTSALITTRLDSDDAIHLRYLEEVQRRLTDFAVMDVPRWLLSFPRGYRFDQATGRLYLDWEPRSPFHSLFERDPEKAKTVLLGNHSILHRQYPTTQDPSLAPWLMVIHGGNAENRLKDYYVGEASRANLAEFGISLDALTQVSHSMPILEQGSPVALRSQVDFGPRRASLFDDPGDERSWRRSQRDDDLVAYYRGRKPEWYAAAVQPLEGAERVLDLGCGPGLALRALRDRGATSVYGIDRWPAFFDDSPGDLPIIAHDITLPMPFIESGSFDGVFTHYVLDYVSPIGVEQALREAHRLLAPGGKLLAYVAAVGLGANDDTRTVPYTPAALTSLLRSAGFRQISVEARGRNSVVVATQSEGPTGEASPGAARQARCAIHGETQLSASFANVRADRVQFELQSDRGNATFDIPISKGESHTGADDPIAVCARVVALPSRGIELQTWAWVGSSPVAAERFRLELPPKSLEIHCDGELRHKDAWTPRSDSLEPSGSAYADAERLAPAGELDEIGRGEEGRRIVVQPRTMSWPEVAALRGKAWNRFLVRRPDVDITIAELDAGWLRGELHGVVLDSSEIGDERLLDIVLWAGRRQALLMIEGAGWDPLLQAVAARLDLISGPTVLVDPELTAAGASARVPETGLGNLVTTNDRLYVVLAAATRERLSETCVQQLSGALLHGGGPIGDAGATMEPNEALRYLTERTLLMRLRQLRHRRPREIGRRPSLG